MSRARHKRENGGAVKQVKWNAEGSNAMKEADEKASGGAVKVRASGGMVKARADRSCRAAGGKVAKRAVGGVIAERAAGGEVTARARGGAVPGRARGGGIGADKRPLSSAATVKHTTKGECDESGTDKVM